MTSYFRVRSSFIDDDGSAATDGQTLYRLTDSQWIEKNIINATGLIHFDAVRQPDYHIYWFSLYHIVRETLYMRQK